MQTKFNINDTISLNCINKKVKDLTIADLYKIYEEDRLAALVKIVNGEVELTLEEED